MSPGTCQENPLRHLRGALERDLAHDLAVARTTLQVSSPPYYAGLRTAEDLADRPEGPFGSRYRIIRRIGTGGMSVVYLAEDLELHRLVAIKVLRQELALSGPIARFQQEVEIAAALNHPNILPVYEAGIEEGSLFYVMQYVESGSLRNRLKQDRMLPLDHVCSITTQISAALDYAHQAKLNVGKGIVHRDLKPENVLLTEDGHAYLADFGIARILSRADRDTLTSYGMIVGTWPYMSPEQCAGSEVDARSDVYSLACLVFEMLAGEPPFTGPSGQAISAKHLHQPPPQLKVARPDIPEGVSKAVNRALAKVPAARFRTAGELAAALAAPRRDGGSERVSIWTHRVAYVAATIVLILVLAGMTWLGVSRFWRSGGPKIRLAVLPLQNIGVPDTEHFAEGLTDEITVRLARLPGVAVVARNNTGSYNANQSLRQVREELDVEYVITGSVQWEGVGSQRRLRVMPNLLRTRDGTHMWAGSLDARPSRLFELQEAIAENIADSLRITLDSSERVEFKAPGTQSIEAYTEYALGRYYFRERDLQGAAEHFNASAERDPSFARAYSGLADSYILFAQYGAEPERRRSDWEKARQFAERARELDKSLSEAYASTGEVTFYADWNWPAAELQFQNALRRDPYNATAHQWYAELLAVTGRSDSAIAESKRAIAFDPKSPLTNHALAISLLSARRYNDAIVQYLKVVTLNPNFWYGQLGLVWAYLAKGNSEEALRHMHAVEKAALGDTTALARIWIRGVTDSRYREEALTALRGAAWPYSRISPEMEPSIYAALGDLDQSLRILERNRKDRPLPPGVLPIPLYDRVRSDRRFQAFLHEVGLDAS